MQRSKTVELNGSRYELRKLTPEVGTSIWHRMTVALWKAQRKVGADSQEAKELTEEQKVAMDAVPPEDKLRDMCPLAFMGLDFEDHRFIQSSCMRAVSRYELNAGAETLMPVMTDNGKWVAEDIADNPFLVTKLTVEVVAYNLASFLSQGAVSATKLAP